MIRRERGASDAGSGPRRSLWGFDHPGFRRWAADLADANRAVITGDFATVQAIVDSAPLVLAVWRDAAEPDGVGVLVVKGQTLLRNIVAGGEARPVEMNAVSCESAGHADALRIAAGETERLH